MKGSVYQIMEGLLSAIVTGIFAFTGVVLTTASSNRRTEQKIAISQAEMSQKIEHLTEEVRKHNNFAVRMPAVEQKLEDIVDRINRMDDKR